MLFAPPRTTRDPHSVRMVTVQPGVKLEVVDWGGKGPTLIFIAGLGNTAHVYDEFAPRFTNKYHAIGITRRGFGMSSMPAEGYHVGRLVEDIVAVMDSLKLKNAVLVGHSIGGDELTAMAGSNPDRVRGLIYLDAAFDHSPVLELFRKYPGPAEYMTKERTDGVPAARLREMLIYSNNAPLPLNEIYQTVNVDRNGFARGDKPSAHGKMWAAVRPVAYRGVKAPALAFFAVTKSAADWYGRRYDELNAADKALADSSAAALNRYTHENIDRVRGELAGVRIVKLFDVGHYVFALEPKRVESEMRSFLAALK
ncbi:MAG TPA: alpha/beta hydrolase, partial [Longimicrobiales bacterium]|nr:alpha/beta hydrolase [Longimicrobiales bacterium]